MKFLRINKTKLACAIGLALSGPATAPAQDKLDVCHMASHGSKVVISLPAKAANKHIVQHYDQLAITVYEDADGDGYGNADVSMKACDDSLVGYVEDDTDLDDTDPTITSAPAPTVAPPTPPSTFAPPPPPTSPPSMSGPPQSPPSPPSTFGPPPSPPSGGF